MKGITVHHKKYGKGKLVSFNPFTNMTIVFNGGGWKDTRTISVAHINDVSINGVPIRNLVDYGDDRWYPRTLKSPMDDSNGMY
ncbi:MAG: hypothetical protein NUW09_09435 [Deltaproteobacteria bacterium]|nr:hypothetical protein [Deltaproteobacteria bacterium]